MRDLMKFGIILMVYSLVAGGALAYVSIKTAPLITENRLAEERNALAEVLPDMAGGYEEKNKDGDFPYWVAYRDAGKQEIGGYIFKAQGTGYSSVISSMVGVDTNGKIVGVKVLSQQETPGLGAKVIEIRHGDSDPWFPRQFKGKTVQDDLKVVKDGGTIDAITGATISSRTVTNSINAGLKKLMGLVGGAS
ncbi:RnfABCDGE type electron transport complex subunit G [bacterium]|nr:RnfABCDGE type electron transport complex subunit G [bacterium]